MNSSEDITILNNNSNYEIEYTKTNYNLKIKNYLNETDVQAVMLLSDYRYVFYLTLRNKKIVTAKIQREKSPIYFSLSSTPECKNAPLPELTVPTLAKSINAKIESLETLKFSKNCDKKLQKTFGSSYSDNITARILDDLNPNSPSDMAYNVNLMTNIKSHDISKDFIKSLKPIDCENISACGSSNPIEKKIILNPDCQQDGLADSECIILSTLAEELLHLRLNVGNEEPAHSDIKKISRASFCQSSEEGRGIFTDISSPVGASRSNFNQSYETAQLDPKDIKPLSNLPDKSAIAANFSVNPSTSTDRELPATAADSKFISSNLMPAFAGFESVAVAAAKKFAAGLPRSLSSTPASAKSLTTRSVGNAINARETTKLTSTDVRKSTAESSVNSQNPSVISSQGSDSPTGQKVLAGQSDVGQRGLDDNGETSQLSLQNRRAAPTISRSTASVQTLESPPQQTGSLARNAALRTNELPNQLKEVVVLMKLSDISTASELAKYIKINSNSKTLKTLSTTLESAGIQVFGIDNKTLGQMDPKKIKYIYQYRDNDNSPRFIKLPKIPTDI